MSIPITTLAAKNIVVNIGWPFSYQLDRELAALGTELRDAGVPLNKPPKRANVGTNYAIEFDIPTRYLGRLESAMSDIINRKRREAQKQWTV